MLALKEGSGFDPDPDIDPRAEGQKSSLQPPGSAP
jgi:hypothetical protein